MSAVLDGNSRGMGKLTALVFERRGHIKNEDGQLKVAATSPNRKTAAQSRCSKRQNLGCASCYAKKYYDGWCQAAEASARDLWRKTCIG